MLETEFYVIIVIVCLFMDTRFDHLRPLQPGSLKFVAILSPFVGTFFTSFDHVKLVIDTDLMLNCQAGLDEVGFQF